MFNVTPLDKSAPSAPEELAKVSIAQLAASFAIASTKMTRQLQLQAGRYLIIGSAFALLGVIAALVMFQGSVQTAAQPVHGSSTQAVPSSPSSAATSPVAQTPGTISAAATNARSPDKAGIDTTTLTWAMAFPYIYHAVRAISMLVFLEVLAVYFLRQYREAMNDFRYFERIQRYREEVLIAVRIADAVSDDELLALLKSNVLFSNAGLRDTPPAAPDPRLLQHEAELIGKLIDAIGKHFTPK